jgi:hypothetical protein
MCVSRVLASGLLLASLLVSSLSWARVPTRLVYLRSQATSACPEQSALEAAVTARLGYEPFSPWGDQTIVVTISRSAQQLIARAELVDHDGIVQGSREVRASPADCGDLIATLALAISITLDPMRLAPPASAAEGASPPASDAGAMRASEPNPEPELAAVVESPRSDHQQTSAALGRERAVADEPPRNIGVAPAVVLQAHAGGVGALAALPHPALGARVGVGLRRAALSLSLEGWATLPSSQGATGGREVRVSLLSGALALCADVIEPFSVCELTTVGRLRGQGRRVLEPKVESVFYAAVGVRGLVTLPLSKALALLGNVDISAALTRPTFQLNNADVWRPSPFVGVAGLALSARFF